MCSISSLLVKCCERRHWRQGRHGWLYPLFFFHQFPTLDWLQHRYCQFIIPVKRTGNNFRIMNCVRCNPVGLHGVSYLHFEQPFQCVCSRISTTLHAYHSFGPLRPIFMGKLQCFFWCFCGRHVHFAPAK